MIRHNRLAQRAFSIFALMALVAATMIPAFGATQRRRPRLGRRTVTRRATPPRVVLHTVPADTVIRVRMDTQLSSERSRVGDRFSTKVTEMVYGSDGVEVIPTGSRVWGSVTSVRRSGRRTPGSISVSFNQVELPNGARYAINGSLSSL